MTGIEILEPGPLTTVQDLGRFGWAHLGVPRAGALDAPAAALANRLVGNGPGAAVLETTLGGVRLRTLQACTLAVTGASCEVLVAGRPRALGLPVTVPAGVDVMVGVARAGVRSYVAFAGGLVVPAVLGSRSTDTLAWVGPPRPAAGDVLPLGPAGHPVGPDVTRPEPRTGVLRLHPGPRADWCEYPLATLCAAPYAVTPASNRVGLRLRGEPVVRRRDGELPSEGLVLGAVQIPPDGQPVVFLHDHPVTGGYPVVAVVDPADLPVCAQARPGAELRFEPAVTR